MDGLFSTPLIDDAACRDLGPSTILQRRGARRSLELDGSRSEIRSRLREVCRCRPGVYGMIDQDGELIYVGMSTKLRDRLLTYFTKGAPEAKEQRIADHARRLVWEEGDHELTVRLRELELIRRWTPRFNSVGRPGRREVGYVYLTRTAAPNFRVAPHPPRTGGRCWGPLPLSRHVRVAVKRLNYLFLLRDCPDRTPVRFVEQRMILPDLGRPECLRGEVGTCLAPCAGDRSQADYWRGVDRACAFLDGTDRSVIEHHERAMQTAAADRQYEHAATHRDIWQSLTALWNQLELVRGAWREHAGVHLLRGVCGRSSWAVVAHGKVLQILREPRSAGGARRCLSWIERAFSAADAVVPEDCEQMRIIISWYRKHPDRRQGILAPERARQECLAHCE